VREERGCGFLRPTGLRKKSGHPDVVNHSLVDFPPPTKKEGGGGKKGDEIVAFDQKVGREEMIIGSSPREGGR